MKIKEFEAQTLKECLNQVRQEMGPEAVILETKKKRVGGFLGFGSKERIQITAALGISVNEAPAKKESPRDTVPVQTTPSPNPPQIHVINDKETREKLNRLEEEIGSIKEGINSIRLAVNSGMIAQQSNSHTNSEFPELLNRLVQSDLPESLALEMLGKLPDLSAWGPQARLPLAEAALRDIMCGMIKCDGAIKLTPGQTKFIALIGPTGVGKTTTIAKLAAHFALVEKKKVGLLTVDTYRIAAVDQLKTYSQIIDIPVRVAYNQSDVAPALQTFKDSDLVLIDTAGRSQKNVMQVKELQSLVEVARCETHLVLSASTKDMDMMEQVSKFSGVGVHRIIFSKLDETAAYGTIFNTATQCQIPISYITTGQKVPEDIEAADAQRLVGIVLGNALQ